MERGTRMEVGKVLRSDSQKNINEEEEEDFMVPGFRFHPTDEELVGFYLQRKVQKKPLRIELIKQIDIYKYDPWDLPKVSSNAEGGIKEGYFFCIRGRKYRNSIRPNRVTASGSGFWKATGIDKPIYGVRDIIGLKKSLVYYRGTAGKGSKTDWMMHEFRLPPNNFNPQPAASINHHLQEAEVWTLCRIFKRIPSHKNFTPAATKLSSLTHSTSNKASSLRSDINGDPRCFTLKDSLIIQQNNERKQIVNNNNNNGEVEQERNHLFLGQFPQAPPPLVSYSYPSFWNPNNVMEEDVFANGNWDELGPVVQLAMDHPSKVYHDCTELL